MKRVGILAFCKLLWRGVSAYGSKKVFVHVKLVIEGICRVRGGASFVRTTTLKAKKRQKHNDAD